MTVAYFNGTLSKKQQLEHLFVSIMSSQKINKKGTKTYIIHNVLKTTQISMMYFNKSYRIGFNLKNIV